MVEDTFSETQFSPPSVEYFTKKLVTGASSRFLISTFTCEEALSSVEVNFLPETCDKMAFNFRSLSEMLPLHVPLLGCLETATALRPALPLILARTLTQ